MIEDLILQRTVARTGTDFAPCDTGLKPSREGQRKTRSETAVSSEITSDQKSKWGWPDTLFLGMIVVSLVGLAYVSFLR